MGFSIDREGTSIRFHIDSTDDIGFYWDERRIYFLYSYYDCYENTEPSTIELIVRLILDKMTSGTTRLELVAQDYDSREIEEIYSYPCSFREFNSEYEMEDVFMNEYLVGYVDLPDLSNEELKIVHDLINSPSCWHDGSISVIYEDTNKRIVPIVDMLEGNGPYFFDEMVVNKLTPSVIPYLTENGFTVEDLQRNFNNLELINKG